MLTDRHDNLTNSEIVRPDSRLGGLLAGDEGLYLKVSHELAHAWFGLQVGAADWAEAWLSEGFATYCEEEIHWGALQRLQAGAAGRERQQLRWPHQISEYPPYNC